MTGRMFLLAHL